ncbi:hypothetical protein DPMN_065399 [Dreissena polymorpha]|uniref:Sushi domain-containing protein n=1 Tax=Dreissena polymorpha TaxID=45954 RepID=A0A9D3YRL5_DREPO|nr:hypothetical protein DPMN_065399 [Dreissena polymorpha]
MNRTYILDSECPPVEPVKNGVILGNSFELDSRRMVRCNLGYCEKTGQTTMLCLNGNWNYTPECVPSKSTTTTTCSKQASPDSLYISPLRVYIRAPFWLPMRVQ